MHGPRGFGLAILTTRLGLLALWRDLPSAFGWEGAVTVGFISGSGVERSVIIGSVSIRVTGATGSATLFGSTNYYR
jgi:hypothetical protein